GRPDPRGDCQRRSWLRALLLYRSGSHAARDHRGVRRSGGHRAELPRRERGLGRGIAAGPQHLDERRRLQLELVGAYARGMLGLEAARRRTLRSQRVSLGRPRPPPVSRRSPQLLAPPNPPERISITLLSPPRLLKNPLALRTPLETRGVTEIGFQKVQSNSD